MNCRGNVIFSGRKIVQLILLFRFLVNVPMILGSIWSDCKLLFRSFTWIKAQLKAWIILVDCCIFCDRSLQLALVQIGTQRWKNASIIRVLRITSLHLNRVLLQHGWLSLLIKLLVNSWVVRVVLPSKRYILEIVVTFWNIAVCLASWLILVVVRIIRWSVLLFTLRHHLPRLASTFFSKLEVRLRVLMLDLPILFSNLFKLLVIAFMIISVVGFGLIISTIFICWLGSCLWSLTVNKLTGRFSGWGPQPKLRELWSLQTTHVTLQIIKVNDLFVDWYLVFLCKIQLVSLHCHICVVENSNRRWHWRERFRLVSF